MKCKADSGQKSLNDDKHMHKFKQAGFSLHIINDQMTSEIRIRRFYLYFCSIVARIQLPGIGSHESLAFSKNTAFVTVWP